MRDIKFRAWDKETNEMLDMVTVACKRKDPWSPLYIKDGIINGIDHQDYVLMQYTGLKDKNGKEIYEGDILKHPIGNIAEIIYIDDLAAFVAFYKINEKNEMDYLDSEIMKMCEVIGNIYENPELLEGEG